MFQEETVKRHTNSVITNSVYLFYFFRLMVVLRELNDYRPKVMGGSSQ